VCELLERLCGTGLLLEAEWQQEPTVWYSKGGFCAAEELQEMVVVVEEEEEEELRVIMAGMRRSRVFFVLLQLVRLLNVLGW
jgi:hypothetical protein